MTIDLSRQVIACIGGDEREREILRLAVASGARVTAYGIPKPKTEIAGAAFAASPAEAANDATVLILPLPGMQGLSVFAPRHAEEIVIDQKVLSRLAPNALVFCGHASPEFARLARGMDLTLHEYEADTAGRLARVPAIVEGAIACIVANTERTIHGATVAVIGYGVVGAYVAAGLRALGATTWVFARSREQQAEAYASGHRAADLTKLVESIPDVDMVVSTTPARVLGDELLARVPPACVVFDLASPPGSVDHAAAERLGKNTVWARGLGATSPQTVGRAQWSVIEALLHK